MQQLLLMFAMRPERITQCAVSFITTVLDSGTKQRRLNYYAPVELSQVAKALRPEQISLVLYRDDPHILLTKLQTLATKSEVTFSLLIFTYRLYQYTPMVTSYPGTRSFLSLDTRLFICTHCRESLKYSVLQYLLVIILWCECL